MYQKRYIACRQNASFEGRTICSISKWLIGERRELGWTVMPRYRKPKCGEANRAKAHMPTVGFRPTCRLDRHRGDSHLPTPATPPCERVRTRRFEKLRLHSPTNEGRPSDLKLAQPDFSSSC